MTDDVPTHHSDASGGEFPDEEELVERIRTGSAEAFAEFAERKRRPLLAFVERKLSDSLKRKTEPQDIVQEVVLRAVEAFADMDFSQRNPFGWLCQLAERRMIDAHRRLFGAQKRSADKEVALQTPGGSSGGGDDGGGLIDLLVASMTSPSKAFSRDQREFRMLEAVADLPEEARTALRLRYVEGLPSKKIAERLEKSDAAVRVLLSRSLNRLQKSLGQDTLFKSFVNAKPQGDRSGD